MSERRPKRITYLTRRTDLERAEFRDHWATTHAEIAKELPGLASYRQNHMVDDPGEARAFSVFDGIVELWFEDTESVTAGIVSDVADRLVVDELNFLSGLVGGAVIADGPTPHWPAKVWLLALWDGHPDAAGVVEWARVVATKASAVGHSVNIVDESGPQLQRAALFVHPRPPQVAVCFGFASEREADDAQRTIAGTLDELGGVTETVLRRSVEQVIV